MIPISWKQLLTWASAPNRRNDVWLYCCCCVRSPFAECSLFWRQWRQAGAKRRQLATEDDFKAGKQRKIDLGCLFEIHDIWLLLLCLLLLRLWMLQRSSMMIYPASYLFMKIYLLKIKRLLMIFWKNFSHK